MARSPTPCTVPTQTSSTSTRDQVRRCLFGVRTQARSPKRASLSADTVEAAPAQRAQNIFFFYHLSFYFFSPPHFRLHVLDIHHTLFLSKQLTSVLVAVIRSFSIQSLKPLKSLVQLQFLIRSHRKSYFQKEFLKTFDITQYFQLLSVEIMFSIFYPFSDLFFLF